jgi:hypothetical protein
LNDDEDDDVAKTRVAGRRPLSSPKTAQVKASPAAVKLDESDMVDRMAHISSGGTRSVVFRTTGAECRKEN